ncbi:hypothetical protein AGMMS49938_10790 [Fibrobacterales bacterium]|nr:hypothetical protein AGMMS49938_10790 [Fibrobacterales bacterium]
MKIILSSLLLFFAVNSYSAYPFVGETLDYEISWGFITAGNARMLVKKSGENKLDIITRAWNNGAFESIYPVNDSVYSSVSADSLLPKKFIQKLSEGSYRRTAQTIYDFKNNKAFIKDTANKPSKNFKTAVDTVVALEGDERCILSAFYLARTLKFEPGDTAYFNAIGGVKRYKLKVICHKRETIKTELGKKNTLVIEPVIQGDGLFKAKGKLTIWLTDDDERLPVLMKSEIAVGSIKAELIKVSRDGGNLESKNVE